MREGTDWFILFRKKERKIQMYTIGQMADMFQIPISTLRYYDKEGLFPGLERSGGIRKFSEKEAEALRVIECLKKSGLEIREIKTFMEWCAEGSSTYEKRRELFVQQEKAVIEEMRRLEKTLAMIRYKQWYYEQALKDGTEDRVRQMEPEEMPEKIRAFYELAFEDMEPERRRA